MMGGTRHCTNQIPLTAVGDRPVDWLRIAVVYCCIHAYNNLTYIDIEF